MRVRRYTTEPRLRGRKLQDTRLRIWSESPFCQSCKKMVFYPDGFELDHKRPIHKGGGDEDENLQVLCPECHNRKTIQEAGKTYRVPIGIDGWPV